MSEENVLVVDDEAVIRDVCEQILEGEGYAVTTAAGGKEALRLVSEHSFDAVVTDIMMPDMSGLELLEVIKRTSMEVSTIVITGLGTFDMATQSDRLGVREFVVKPFTPDELSEAVRKALRQHGIGAG
ncbi:MAG: response regulator [Thermoleophilia bacterium]